MSDKKRIYEADFMALPPLRMVLGDVPAPDPDRRRKVQQDQVVNREMETSVKKLIAHLKEKEK